MRVSRWFRAVLLAALAACSGCTTPQARTIQSQNAALVEQNRALSARMENLEIHSRHIESQLLRAEEDLARSADERTRQGEQLASFREQRNELNAGVRSLAGRGVTAATGRRLAELSERFPRLRFDPHTGISKFDTDVLFDIGSAELKPAAAEELRTLARALSAPEAADLKVVVAGHTDDRRLVKKPARDLYRDNFHLSTERSLAVAAFLREAGLAEERIAVAGFAAHQPIAPPAATDDQEKNRRVEVFVLAPEVPVVGWTDSIPTVY